MSISPSVCQSTILCVFVNESLDLYLLGVQQLLVLDLYLPEKFSRVR